MILNRNLAILIVAQLFSVAGTVAVVTLGGIVGEQFAPTPTLATLPASLMIVGTALATIPAAQLMSRVGRARGFALGATLAAIGQAVSVFAMFRTSFVLFCVGTVLIGLSLAFSQQYRFAAAESVAVEDGAKAVSIVLAGSIGGALLGPWVAANGQEWLSAPFAGTFAVFSVAAIVMAFLLTALKDRAVMLDQAGDVPATPIRELFANPLFPIAVGAGVVGHGVMTFVMTATPLAMHVVDHHSLDATAQVIQAHVLAMYVPSLFTGLLMTRFGVHRVMVAGALLLLATIVAGFWGREVLHYGIAMTALGVGWNFLYIGGTTLLGRSHRFEDRFRAQAVNEFSVFGFSALGSLGAGTVMVVFGWNWILTVALVPILLIGLALSTRTARTAM